MQNVGQIPCWYGTANTVTPANGTLLDVNSGPVLLEAGTNYYCITATGTKTEVLVTTWQSNIPGSGGGGGGGGTGINPLINPVGEAAAGSWSAATTATVALSSSNVPMTVGDLVLVAVDEFLYGSAPPSVSAISDTNGNTWTKITRTGTSGSTSTNAASELWYTIVTAAGATTVTLTISSATGTGQVTVAEFSKTVGASWNIDVTGTNSSTSSNSINFPTLTPTSPFEMYVGSFATTGSPGTATYPTGYSVAYPMVYNANVSSAQNPSIGVTNDVLWATVAACIGVFTPSSNATQLQGVTVANTAPASGQVLEYNGTSWTPVTGSSGNATTIQGVAVSTTAPTSGQVLEYNGTNYAPTSLAANATELQGVSVSSTAPSSGQVLEYNGTAWTPTTPSGGGGSGEPLTFNTVSSASGSYTLASPTTAQVNWYTMSGDITLTMPALAQGDNFILWVDQPSGGAYTLTFATSPAIRWVGGTAATQPGSAQRLYIQGLCDGTDWCLLIVANAF